MRTLAVISRAFMVSGLIILLSACAEENSPTAFDMIHPELDESGYMQALVRDNPHVMTLMDSVVQQGVPVKVATTAFLKYDQFKAQIRREEYMVMIDFTQHSGNKRMYMVNRTTGAVEALVMAHGEGSDPDGDGYAQLFSNTPDSKMSSLGSYLVAEKYSGKWGASMRLDGLESTNDNVRKRAIVMHRASYVVDGKSEQGLSWGCPAIPYAWIDRAITRLRDGAFMYAYGENKYVETPQDIMIQQMSLLPTYKWTDESNTPGTFR